jgi:hypothetical protein
MIRIMQLDRRKYHWNEHYDMGFFINSGKDDDVSWTIQKTFDSTWVSEETYHHNEIKIYASRYHFLLNIKDIA